MRAKYLHAVESMTNVIVGYGINLILVHYVLHAMGYAISFTENASMGLLFAVVSFIRGYSIRRVFNKIIQRVYYGEKTQVQEI